METNLEGELADPVGGPVGINLEGELVGTWADPVDKPVK